MGTASKSWGIVVTALSVLTIASAATAQYSGGSATAARAETGTYIFLPGQSTITQTGGIAGIHRTYTITGTFQLAADFEAGTASFNHVDANAVDDSPYRHALDPNEVFNMTGLAGTVVDRTIIRFEGTADPSAPLRASFGSSVLLTLTFADDTVTLKGETTPPPNSADFFLFTLDVVAQRKYSGGTGEPNDPYQIATAADLIALGETSEDYDKHFLLTSDIDLDPNLPGRKVFDRAVIAPDMNDATWGFDGTSFAGVFDGNGHVIRHLTIVGVHYVGLFGTLDPGATVSNLGLEAVDVRGASDYVGALVGLSYGSIVTSYNSGFVIGNEPVGGLVGYNAGNITMSYSTAWVAGTRNKVGGLVGWNDGSIATSYSTGSVNPVRDGGGSVGGLVGDNDGSITASYSTASVDGVIFLGGLVGANSGSVAMSHSSGSVSGWDCVGGLVGYNDGSITASYSTGWVRALFFGGSTFVGGLVGRPRSGSVSSSFWDIQTSRQPKTAKSVGTGKTTAEMQMASTFRAGGWHFVGETPNATEDLWWILEGKDYPRLSWQLPTDDFDDGKPGPLWFVHEPEPERVRLKEVNGRLEVEAIAQSEDVDAIYVADGWRLDAKKGFAIRVDFHFSKQGGGNGRVTLGVVPSLDPAGMQWAELEAGCFESGPFYLYEVRDGSWVQEVVTERSSDGGTLYMSYNPDTDELYFSFTGHGKANAWQTVKGLLKGRWASVPVSVILSGGSQGLALTGADAWLDNFVVSSGALVLN